MVLSWVLGGCAMLPPPPQPGMAAAELLRTWGPPTAHHAMPDGSDRL